MIVFKNFLPNKFLSLSTNSSFVVVVLSIISGFIQSIAIFTLFPLMVFLDVNDNSEGFTKFIDIYELILNFLNLNNSLFLVLSFMILFVTLSSIINFLIHIYSSKISLSIARKIRNEYTDSITNASWTFFLEKNTGEIVNSLITESEAISSGYQTSIKFYSQLIQGFIILFSTFFIDTFVALASLFFGIIMILIFGNLLNITKLTGQNIRQSMNQISKIIIDYLYFIKPLKAMNMEKKLIPILSKQIKQLETNTLKFYILKGLPTFFKDPILICLLSIGIYFIISYNLMSTILIVPMSLLFIRSSQTLSLSFSSFQSLKRIEVFYDSLNINLKKSKEMNEIDNGSKEFNFKKNIIFNNVCFSYGRKKIFDTINFKIHKNSFNLIVGESGLGKTTLIDLISRIHNPKTGNICIDDINISEFKLSSLRKNIGYVPQEFTFFNGSVRDNITMGDKFYSDEAIIDILKLSSAEFVLDLNYGIDTLIGEKGFALSGGQRQRLSLSRALIKQPKILILDEPTSNLDQESKKDLINCLEKIKLISDITIIMISHDLIKLKIDYTIFKINEGKILKIK